MLSVKAIDVWRIVDLQTAAERAKVPASRLRGWKQQPDFPEPFLRLEDGKVVLFDWLAVNEWIRTNAPYGYLAKTLRQGRVA